MILYDSLTTGYPASFAVGTNGVLYFANGQDAVMRWDGEYETTPISVETCIEAGLVAPSTAVTAAGSGSGGSGCFTGTYRAYVRYLDADNGIGSSFDALGDEFTCTDAHTGISYTNVPVLADTTRTIHRQIWRSTAGQQTAFYLDATIENNTATTASSTKTDSDLRESEAMRFLTNDGYPNAHRFGVPPSHMAVVVAFQDRLWFAVSSQDAYKRSIFFSEPEEPESVPSVNELKLQDDGDEITGLMPHGSYLYILTRHHLYRLATSGNPRVDAGIALVAGRGCVSQRCWTRVEGSTLLLDEDGPWVFNGSSPEAIGDVVHDYVTDRINWDVKDTFGVAKDTLEETVRFFVALDNDTHPQHSLAFNYRLGRFWLEDYSSNLYAVGEAEIEGMRRTVFCEGTDIYYLDSGSYSDESTIDYQIRLGPYRFLDLKPANLRRFEIYFEPVEFDAEANDHSPELYVDVYLDRSDTAETAQIGREGDLNVTTTLGSTHRVIDLTHTSGYASFSFSGGHANSVPGPRTVEFVLSGTAYQHMRFYEVILTGVQ